MFFLLLKETPTVYNIKNIFIY